MNMKERWQNLRRGPRVVISVLGTIVLCCTSCFCWAFTDAVLRDVGVLPTHTPRPTNTPTATPTITLTPSITPTAAPTDTEEPTNTARPTRTTRPSPTPRPTRTTAPTRTPAPTATTRPPTIAPTQITGPFVVITNVNKQREYVDIANLGTEAQDLTGWWLLSERGAQSCALSGVLQPGATLRIWALAGDADQGGFNCGFGSNIWNNDEPDAAILYDAQGNEVSRR